jgi:hypothetical protein
MASTSVFLENESDWSAASSGSATKYALQAEKVTVVIQKNPIQIAAPKNSPYLFDLGTYKPTITITGTVDDQSSGNSVSLGLTAFKLPTAYQISRLSTDWWFDTTQVINLYIQEPDSGSNASYFKYKAALSTVTVDYKAGSEERPEFSMIFFTGRPKVYYPHMTIT